MTKPPPTRDRSASAAPHADPDDPYLSLTDLAGAYRRQAMRPSRVIRAHLDRIAALEPRLGAFQAVYAEEAMRLGEAADRMFDAGSDQGPFHGIPFVLKDICDVSGRVTTGGSKAMEQRISPQTGTLAARLFASGGIMLGKTKTVECALGGWGTNQKMGTPWNPWDMGTQRVPGGSSSGTGVSVAAGLAVCGVGTDTGGSVRLPAAFCGIVGLKVTEGRLPTDGILPLSSTLDTPGPMARSVEDALAMFMAMDGAEGWTVARQLAAKDGPFRALEAGVAGLRLGVLDDAERAGCTPDVLADYDAALERLRGLGAEVHPLSAPRAMSELTASCGRLIVAEAYFNHRHLYDREDLPLDEDVRTRMLAGRGVSAVDYLQLLADRKKETAAFLESMRGLDAFVTPSTLETAPPVATVDQDVSPGHFSRFVNWLGICALSVPAGLSADGLPTSLQIVARPGDETTALRVGAAFERTRGPFPAPPLD